MTIIISEENLHYDINDTLNRFSKNVTTFEIGEALGSLNDKDK